eukprot:7495586-Lingulodinium_polyedra.AAC.1
MAGTLRPPLRQAVRSATMPAQMDPSESGMATHSMTPGRNGLSKGRGLPYICQNLIRHSFRRSCWEKTLHASHHGQPRDSAAASDCACTSSIVFPGM